VYVEKLAASLLLAFATFSANAACNIDYRVNLETFGERVNVELRKGTPGKSKLIKSTYSSGGAVFFGTLCPGSYFVAIGNDDSVSVTPPREFEDNMTYQSTLRMQRGSGNVTNRSRGSL
jgi:hypothetical protein